MQVKMKSCKRAGSFPQPDALLTESASLWPGGGAMLCPCAGFTGALSARALLHQVAHGEVCAPALGWGLHHQPGYVSPLTWHSYSHLPAIKHTLSVYTVYIYATWIQKLWYSPASPFHQYRHLPKQLIQYGRILMDFNSMKCLLCPQWNDSCSEMIGISLIPRCYVR